MKGLIEFLTESSFPKTKLSLDDIYSICLKYPPKKREFNWEKGSIKRPMDSKPFDGVYLSRNNKWYRAIFYIDKDGYLKLANVFSHDRVIPDSVVEYTINFLTENIWPAGGFNDLEKLNHEIIINY